MSIGFIGAGKVGTALGMYLKSNGFLISGYFSRSEKSRQQSALLTQSNCYDTMKQLVEASELIFITTNDDEIERVVQQLCQNSCLKPNQLVIHTSGALPSTILSPLKAFGCNVYSMHPLLSFADIEKAAEALKNSYFCIEGDEEKMPELEHLLQVLGNKYFKLKPEQKTLYHASACMVSNYLVTLIHSGLKLMENIDIDRETAFRAMLPLINSTIQNILTFGTENALTGPISRGDEATLSRQLDAISRTSPEQLYLFTHLAAETIELASTAKLKDNEEIEKLRATIKSYI